MGYCSTSYYEEANCYSVANSKCTYFAQRNRTHVCITNDYCFCKHRIIRWGMFAYLVTGGTGDCKLTVLLNYTIFCIHCGTVIVYGSRRMEGSD